MAGIKRSNSLHVNTKDYCFFCINEIADRTKQRRHSLQHLSRYLNINIEKVLKSFKAEASSISLHDLTNVNVTVCVKCDKVMTQLSDTFQFLETLKMEMDHLVTSVQSTIAESNVNSDSHWKYWKKMSENVDATFNLDVANELRMMLLEKCSKQAGKVRPVVVTRKLSKDWNKLFTSSSKTQNVDDPETGRRKNPKGSVYDSDSSDEELFIPVQVKSMSKKRRKASSVILNSVISKPDVVIPEQKKSAHKIQAEIMEVESDNNKRVSNNQHQEKEENDGVTTENIFQCKTCQKALDKNSLDKGNNKVDNGNDAWQFYFENSDPQPMIENNFNANSESLLIRTSASAFVEKENQNAINSDSEEPKQRDHDTTPVSRANLSCIQQDPHDIQTKDKQIKFKCNLCPSKFKQVKSLQRHFRSIHLNETIPCPNCDKVFRSKQSLRYHAESSHFGIKHCCTYPNCDKVFTYRRGLKQHIESSHSGKKYICAHSNCDKVFVHKKSLKDHLEIGHSDTKYFCTVPNCIKYSRGYAGKKAFLKHAKLNHSNITGWKDCFKTICLTDSYQDKEFEASQFEDLDDNLQFKFQMADDDDNYNDNNENGEGEDEIPFLPSEFVCTLMEM